MAAAADLGLPPPEAPKLHISSTEPVGHSAISINLLPPKEDNMGGGGGGSGVVPMAPMQRANSDTAIVQRKMERRRQQQQQQQQQQQRGVVGRVLRTLPSLGPAPATIPQLAAGPMSLVTGTYYCQICMSNEPLPEGYTLPCEHTFCRECIQQYLQIKVREAQVEHFKCPFIDDHALDSAAQGWACQACTFINPHPDGEHHPGLRAACAVCATEQDVPPPEEAREPGCQLNFEDPVLEDLLEAEDLAKYHRFREMKENRYYRECPKCQTANVDGPTLFSNQLTCGSCSYRFCYVHSDAHPDQGCRQYERAHRIEEAAARALISSFTRACPGCKRPIEKNGGCNHMTCPNCSTDFCWLCGRRIAGGTYPTHYAWWNVTGCPGVQMSEDMREGVGNSSSSLMMCAYRIFYLVAVLVGLSCTIAAMCVVLGLSLAWIAVGGVFLLCIPVICVCKQCDAEDESQAIVKCAFAPCFLVCSDGCPCSD